MKHKAIHKSNVAVHQQKHKNRVLALKIGAGILGVGATAVICPPALPVVFLASASMATVDIGKSLDKKIKW